MELAFVIYLVDNLCSMKGLFWDLGNCVWLAVILSVVALVCFGLNSAFNEEGSWDSEEKAEKKKISYDRYNNLIAKYFPRIFFWTLPVFILGSVLNTAIPSKDTAYKMLAAYGVQETVVAAQQSEYVQKMTGKSLQLLEKTVDKYLEESDNTDQETKEISSKKQSKENK